MGLRGAENHISNLLCDPDREAAAAGPELTPPSLSLPTLSRQQGGGGGGGGQGAGWAIPQTRGQGVAGYGP